MGGHFSRRKDVEGVSVDADYDRRYSWVKGGIVRQVLQELRGTIEMFVLTDHLFASE
jgi:hypothetical protein